jgi:DNA-binding transcriptional LysR family regulator
MNMPDLHAFAVFADHLNFTRAAAALHISQPALHVKVRKLGERVGRPLYRRTGRSLALTPEGAALAAFAREHDTRLAELLAELRTGTPTRPIVLAAGAGAFLYVLADALRAVLAEQPLRLLTADRPAALAGVREGEAQLGVAVLEELPDDLVAVPLARYPQHLLVPRHHPLARRRRVAVNDLGGLALVLPPPGRPHRVAIERALRGAVVDWSVAVEADGWPLQLHFASLGVGAAIVNGCVPAPPGLVARPVSDLPATRYYAVHRRGALDDPRVASLLTALRRGVATADRGG